MKKNKDKVLIVNEKLELARAVIQAEFSKTYVRSGLREALMSYVLNASLDFDYAVTLTFSDRYGRYGKKHVINEQEARNIGRYFCSLFNEAMGFNNYRQKVGKDKAQKIMMFAVLEQGSIDKRWHYHAIFALGGKVLSIKLLEDELFGCWKRAGGGKVNDLQEIYNTAGWLDYITKEIKTNSAEAVNWDMTHIY
ncbi:hypothetical protein [Colwellia piezophila]|uniref:hypothetical protein n=1 Tax=Colwellia piezophila TaxID=211668 RepID=UPI000378BF8E|nr:hypothetical protein [Colwellia piezophila]